MIILAIVQEIASLQRNITDLKTDIKNVEDKTETLKDYIHHLEMNMITKTDHTTLVSSVDNIKITMAKYLGGFAVIIFVAEWYFRSH